MRLVASEESEQKFALISFLLSANHAVALKLLPRLTVNLVRIRKRWYISVSHPIYLELAEQNV